MAQIAERINEARKLKGLTQEQLAESAKVNLRTVQRIEKNESNPRGKTLSLICEVLGLDLEELLETQRGNEKTNYGKLFVDYAFLVILNLIMIAVLNFMTIDSEANTNSRVGAVLLSFFLPIFIVWATPNLNDVERMLMFGIGLIADFILFFALQGFVDGLMSGLFICQAISLGVLFYGSSLFGKN